MSTIFASYTPLIPPTPSVFIYDCFIMTVTHQGVPSLRRLTLLFSATIDFLKLLIQWRTSKIFISMLACWLLLSLLRSCLSKNLLKFHGTVSQSCLEDYISIFLSHWLLQSFYFIFHNDPFLWLRYLWWGLCTSYPLILYILIRVVYIFSNLHLLQKKQQQLQQLLWWRVRYTVICGYDVRIFKIQLETLLI